MADRHEFRFVVDGLALTNAQKERIALAVQSAALEAIAAAGAKLDSRDGRACQSQAPS